MRGSIKTLPSRVKETLVTKIHHDTFGTKHFLNEFSIKTSGKLIGIDFSRRQWKGKEWILREINRSRGECCNNHHGFYLLHFPNLTILSPNLTYINYFSGKVQWMGCLKAQFWVSEFQVGIFNKVQTQKLTCINFATCVPLLHPQGL